MANDPIQVGGPYVENENHVPDPTDMVAQFNTEGVGAHQRIEEVSPIFEVDKVKTAQEILGALDPENDAVSSDRVLLPEVVTDNDVARDQITEVAKARVEKGVVIGGPTPAEREAALEGEEGSQAAAEQERQNAAGNSTGNRTAGQHGEASEAAGSDSVETRTAGDSGSKSDDKSKSTTKKAASSSSSKGKEG